MSWSHPRRSFLLTSQSYACSFLLLAVTRRQRSSISSSLRLKESWRLGHQRASSSPASIWFSSLPATELPPLALASPSPLHARRQESQSHPVPLTVSLLSLRPLVTPAEPTDSLPPYTPTSNCVGWLQLAFLLGLPFFVCVCHNVFAFPPFSVSLVHFWKESTNEFLKCF